MDDAPVILPIQLTPAQVRPIAYRVISKKHGLNLKSAALDVLSRFLGHQFGADWRGPQAERTLDEISKRWKDEDRGIFVDGPPLAQVIKDWLNAEASSSLSSNQAEKKFDWRQYFKVVNTTDQRKFTYNSSKKNFELGTDPFPKAFGDAHSLSSVFATRYNILLDKVYRNEMFQPSGIASESGALVKNALVYTISPIKNLLGRGPGSEFFLLGLLEKQEDGPWVLHDSTSSIKLELSEHTVYAPDHFYTSGSFVLCHGHFLGDCFQVATLGPPPPERRDISQEAYGHIDFYGLHGNNAKFQRIERIDPSLRQVMVAEEQKMPDNRIVIAGANLYLDRIPVLDALKRMMQKLEKKPPMALVLPGSFISVPFQPHMASFDGRNGAQIYRDGMNVLADLLSQSPRICAETKIILIPGSNDPWHAASMSVLPFRPLPKIFTGRVERAASDIVFATNPCRLCYLSQELVLFRDDTGAKLRKHSIDTGSAGHESSTQDPVEEPSERNHSLIRTTADLDRLDDTDKNEERLAERAAAELMIESNSKATSLNAGKKRLQTVSDTEEARQVMATLLDQCHVSPFIMSKSPVIWEFDHTLSLAQWPTVLALIDPSTPAIKQTYEGCAAMNPGSFYCNEKANWLEFWPATGDFDFSTA